MCEEGWMRHGMAPDRTHTLSLFFFTQLNVFVSIGHPNTHPEVGVAITPFLRVLLLKVRPEGIDFVVPSPESFPTSSLLATEADHPALTCFARPGHERARDFTKYLHLHMTMTRRRGEQELKTSGWEELRYCHLHEAILFRRLLFPRPWPVRTHNAPIEPRSRL